MRCQGDVTALAETIEALERALIALEGKIRSDENLASHYPDAKPSNIARKRKADAARLDALAKALREVTVAVQDKTDRWNISAPEDVPAKYLPDWQTVLVIPWASPKWRIGMTPTEVDAALAAHPPEDSPKGEPMAWVDREDIEKLQKRASASTVLYSVLQEEPVEGELTRPYDQVPLYARPPEGAREGWHRIARLMATKRELDQAAACCEGSYPGIALELRALADAIRAAATSGAGEGGG
jgi:hypothetical protein